MPRPGQAYRYGTPFRTSVTHETGQNILDAARRKNRSPDFIIAEILESWSKDIYQPWRESLEKKKPPAGG